jgi:hypothetical protein
MDCNAASSCSAIKAPTTRTPEHAYVAHPGILMTTGDTVVARPRQWRISVAISSE